MIPCTFRQLEIFVAAAEDCHFARTANRLGISQPAVTHHILALEERLGKQLFVRRRGTTPLLSTDGVAFLKQSRRMLDVGATIKDFRGVDAPRETRRVRVCAGSHILDERIKPTLHEFYRREPGIFIDCILIHDLSHGLHMVRKAAAEMVVFAAASPSADQLHAEVIRPIRFGLYAGPDYAQYCSAPAETISELPFILPLQGTAVDKMMQEALARVGIWCEEVVARAQFFDVMADLAKRGVGVVPLFETMVQEAVERGELVKFDLELPPRYWTMFRTEREPAPEVRRVEAYIREILA